MPGMPAARASAACKVQRVRVCGVRVLPPPVPPAACPFGYSRLRAAAAAEMSVRRASRQRRPAGARRRPHADIFPPQRRRYALHATPRVSRGCS